jgi:DNA-directed RNA polymerase subunit RPC12/RpoP
MPEQETEITIEVEHQSIRGRVCPECGGKIIPSSTAVYQSSADPSAVYISWQCERCGHEEVFESSEPGARKHVKVPPSKLEPVSEAGVVSNGAAHLSSEALETPNGSKAHDLPPDVRKLLAIMKNYPQDGH